MMTSDPSKVKVLSLGQCGADSYSIASMIESRFAAAVVAVATLDEAERMLASESFALVLINRILDANGASGLTCLAQLRKQHAKTAMMLVSNHAHAQQDAIKLGAVPGFGKSALRDASTIATLTPFLTCKAES